MFQHRSILRHEFARTSDFARTFSGQSVCAAWLLSCRKRATDPQDPTGLAEKTFSPSSPKAVSLPLSPKRTQVRLKSLLYLVWLRQIHSEPTGGLRCKSAVYGLNGHRSYYIISLFKATYKSTIQLSRNFNALFTKALENSDTCDSCAPLSLPVTESRCPSSKQGLLSAVNLADLLRRKLFANESEVVILGRHLARQRDTGNGAASSLIGGQRFGSVVVVFKIWRFRS
jgi:hypothetical protein